MKALTEQAMFKSHDILSRCDDFVESEESHSGYRFHIRDEVRNGFVTVITFYMRTDIPDLAEQILHLMIFIKQEGFKLEKLSVARDSEL
ncbi:MAG: hypothetical protein IJ884_05615 [Bacteroidales bacterium]|nr:hypothetical protein [Bacteroidales bacterium]